MATTHPRRQSRRRLWYKVCSVPLGVLLGLMLAEIGLRLFGVSYPLPYVPDPYCGSRLRAGMTALFSAEGRAVVRFNKDGYRDRQHTRTKPEGTFRIAVLGDSYAEALQVDQSEAFWSVLEHELGTLDDGRRVEVLNFSVSGYGTAQELAMLRHYVWQYNPDLVLLAFVTGNDLSDNSKRLSPDAVRPYYVPTDHGLVLDQSFRQHPYYLDAQSSYSKAKVAWINRLRLLQLARQLKVEWAERRPKPDDVTDPGLDPIYQPPLDEAWEEAWQITEQLLLMVRDEVRGRGAELCVVTLSNAIQVHPDRQVREAVEKRLGVADLFYADNRIAQLGQREGFQVIELAPNMQRYAEQHNVFLHGFSNTHYGIGHWNADGHRLAGQLIAKEIILPNRSTHQR